MRYLRSPAAMATICSLLLPVAAHGQADSQLDPNSPAGVEYQLPLEQARKNAARKPGSRGDTPLFGAGIVAANAADRAAGGGARDKDSANGGQAGSDASSAGSAGGDGPGGDDKAAGVGALNQFGLPSPDEDGGSAALRIAGIALAVLLVGALLGFLLRRGLREPGS